MIQSVQTPLAPAAPSPSTATSSTAANAQGWLAHLGAHAATDLDLGTLMAIWELARDGLAPRDGQGPPVA